MAPLPARSQPTVDAIYAAYEASGNKPYQTPRLGAATIGEECARKLWYTFRWTTPKVFSGRLLRLFRTGHMQEARLVDDLRKSGVTVHDVDDATGKQWELTDETGHIVCRMDGALIGLHAAPKTWHVFEAKTHNEKSFKALCKEGVEAAKPEHFAQCQIGMHFTTMQRAYYLGHNKDTDALYEERLPYNMEYSVRLVARAHRVIFADEPPERISQNPEWFKCKLCDHRDKCHGGAIPERSCRNCLHVRVHNEGGKWSCDKHGHELDRDAQRLGCGDHRYIPALIPGVQTDVTQFGGLTIHYALRSGGEFLDMGRDVP